MRPWKSAFATGALLLAITGGAFAESHDRDDRVQYAQRKDHDRYDRAWYTRRDDRDSWSREHRDRDRDRDHRRVDRDDYYYGRR